MKYLLKLKLFNAILVVFFSNSLVVAQSTLRNFGENIFIGEKSEIYIKGSLENKTGITPGQIVLDGLIEIEGDLINTSDSLLNRGNSSTLKFTGSTPSKINSSSPLNVRYLVIDKQGQKLGINNTNVFIYSALTLGQGSIVLNNSNIEFREDAKLVNENNTDEYIYGDGAIELKNQNTGTGFSSLAHLGFYVSPELPSVKANVLRYNAVTEAGEESIDLLYKVTIDKRSDVTIGLRYRDALKSAVHTEPDLNIYVSRDSLRWRKLETKSFNTITNEITAEVEQLDQAWFTIAPSVCENIDTISIEILQKNAFCLGTTTTLLASPMVNDLFIWNDTDAVDSLVVSEDKDYKLTRITTQGCEVQKVKSIVKATQPIASFETPTYQCKGDVFSITNTSTNNLGDNSNEYRWVLDSTEWITTLDDPVFPSQVAGLRKIELIAFNAEGCADTAKKDFPIFDVPEINTNLHAGYCDNEEINLVDSSLIINKVQGFIDDVISVREWSVNGGSIISGKEINYPQTEQGIYNLTLEVTTARNCKSILDTTLIVNTSPEASFVANDTCVGSLITTKEVLPEEGSKTWFINEQLIGSSDDLLTPDTSEFNVSLIVENSFNCVDTSKVTLSSFATPTASFTIADTCAGRLARLTNNTELIEVPISYEWFNNQETFSTEILPGISLDTIGEFDISLVASTDKGCFSKETIRFNSFEVPVASFAVNDVCQGDETLLNNTSSGVNNTYQLKLDIEGSFDEFISQYQFDQTGIKTSKLIATSPEGCMDSTTVAHEVFANPDFEIQNVITCIDTMLIESPLVDENLSYLWSSGSTDSSIVLRLDGLYDLAIQDTNNCTTSKDFTVELNRESKDISILPDTLVCDSLIINAEQFNSTYLWSTGETTPSIKIDKDRVVNIKIVDEFACEFYDTIAVKVDSTPSLNLTESFIACENDTVFVTPETDFGVPLWSNGSTVLDQELLTSEELVLTLSSPAGNCRTKDSTQVTFFTYPEVNLGSDTTVCDEYVLFDQVVADTTFWQVGTQDSLVFNKSETEILTAINGGICVSRDTVVVEVFDTPALLASNLFTACEGNEINIQLNEAEQYLWSNGDTTSSQKFVNNDTTRITLTNGICVAQDTLFISFFEVPQFSFGEDSVRCASDRIAYSFNESGFNNQWYSEATGLISTSEEVELTESGTYWLESRDNGICSVTDTINLTVVEDVEADFLSSSIAEIEDSLFFVAVNDKPADSYFWDFGNGFTSTEKNIINQYFIPDTYDVSLIVTLGNCADTLTQEITIYNEGESPIDLFIEEVAEVVLEDSDAFPNPFNTQLNVLVELSDEGEVSLYLYDLLGESRFQKTYRTTSFREDIETANLIPGKYTLYIITGRQRVSYNLVKE